MCETRSPTTSSNQITEHVIEHHKGEEKEVKCPACKEIVNFGGDAQMFEDHYGSCYKGKLKQKYSSTKSNPDYKAPVRIPQVRGVQA